MNNKNLPIQFVETRGERDLFLKEGMGDNSLPAWSTEESFAALVEENTDDGGSLGTGGLYEGVAPGSNFVEEFRAWAIDAARLEGETDIVKTQFGYHIMYYVSGEPYWRSQATVQLAAERMTEKTEGAEAKWPMVVNFKKIALAELNLG